MGKSFLVLLAICLVPASEAIRFNNAYIQNVKSGQCVTINNDVKSDPLSVTKCLCDFYQFWKNDDSEHVINELANFPYIDVLDQKQGNGDTVGIFSLSGTDNQKWKVNRKNGNYAFVAKHSGKCLHEGPDGKVDQWDCSDNDEAQQWKVVENPCPFRNAYIQNVKSGQCVTINKDVLLDPLSATKCNCGPYQFWKMDDGEHVINELAKIPYMDVLHEKTGNGETVGIWSFSKTPNQKWKVSEDKNGNYAFVAKHSGKCLHESPEGKIDQWDCSDNDEAQQWKLKENPCGKLPSIPSGSFQLQNTQTRKCAVPINNSNKGWAKVVPYECSCSNNYQYWNWDKLVKFYTKPIVQELRNIASKQCLANWEAENTQNYVDWNGVTQSECHNNAIHGWRLIPLEEGSFNIISQNDGRCVTLETGSADNTQLQFATCDRNDSRQKWKYHDECHQEATNIIPTHLSFLFDSGSMNWLTPTRYTLLINGHWVSTTLSWITPDGRHIQPDTPLWTLYFGDTVKPSLLSILFPPGKTGWNDVFSWMDINFFQKWTGWIVVKPPQPEYNIIPDSLKVYFNDGQMNWLTPERYTLLVGGRWDPERSVWITVDGTEIYPSTPEWTIYFGELTPTQLSIFFPNGSSWDDVFGWMNSDFFKHWKGWKLRKVTTRIPIVISGRIPQRTITVFASGRMNWLIPDRIKLLEGGEWTGSEYVTGSGVHIIPGTTNWIIYFGSAEPADVISLFGGAGGKWDSLFLWLSEAVKNVPPGVSPGGNFPWDTFFKQFTMTPSPATQTQHTQVQIGHHIN